MEELEQALEIVRGENEALEGKVTTLEEFAVKEKKYRQLWRLNCDQLSDYDAALTDKEDEIVARKKRIAELEAASSLPVVSGHSGASTTLSTSVDVIGTHSKRHATFQEPTTELPKVFAAASTVRRGKVPQSTPLMVRVQMLLSKSGILLRSVQQIGMDGVRERH